MERYAALVTELDTLSQYPTPIICPAYFYSNNQCMNKTDTAVTQNLNCLNIVVLVDCHQLTFVLLIQISISRA